MLVRHPRDPRGPINCVSGDLSELEINFRTIRSYGGGKDRAFEELAYQLLTTDLDRSHLRLTRTGNPDAGTEWYTTDLATGVQEGWQAKYIFGIDDLLGGMTDSVKAVCKKRPEVKRLTFVIPWNLPDGRREGTKSARQKYEDKIRSWKAEIDGAEALDFDLVDESALLAQILQERHRGVVRFFFDTSILSGAQLQQRYEEAQVVAGRRYRPELQVDIPLQDQLEAAAKRGAFRVGVQDELDRLRRDSEEARPLGDALQERSEAVIEAVRCAVEASEDWATDTAALAIRVDALRSNLEGAADAIEKLSEAARSTDEQLKQQAEEAGERYPKQNGSSYWERSYQQRQLADPIWRLLQQLRSAQACLFVGRPLFLTGAAGSGKTHLLLDAWGRAIADERPYAALFADQFGPGPVWPQLAALLGLPSGISKGEVLSALNACGAAATDTRFILAIDALNETTESTFWARVLPELEAAIRSLPHVSLVVTVRSTYVDAIDPEARRSSDFVHTDHPGLSGREHEATHLYFEHYRMEAPRYPLLTPEFSNPLFLQLYCETFQGGTQPPQGSESRIKVFSRLVERSLNTVAGSLASSGTETARATVQSDARRVLDAVLDELVKNGGETVPFDDAVATARAAAAASDLDGARVLAELEAHGLLATAPLWFDEGRQRGVRVTFQALADYLLLQRRWSGAGLSSAPDQAFIDWLRAASWGVQEAAAVWLPEVSGIELRELLDPHFDDDRWGSRFDEMTVKSLAFRSIASISGATVDVVNRCLQSPRMRNESVYSELCAIAPIPNHPLNADRLHEHLARVPMADRDAVFGVAIYDVLDDDGPFLRLARWAQAGPYPDYNPEVVELAVIPLVWLLTSPNRRMRDWITKVLVRLLAGHPDVARALVGRFAQLDDLYVRERLAAIVYGLLMRSDSGRQEAEHRALVTAVVDAYLRRPTPHALMLDHVEGIVELAQFRGLLDANLEVAHVPPYGFKPPHHPWTMKYIDGKYGYHRNNSEEYDFSYSGIYGSLFSMGDFGKYQVDSTFRRFSNRTLDEDPPARALAGEWVYDEGRYEDVVAAADPVVVRALFTKLKEGADATPPYLPELTDAEEQLSDALRDCRTFDRSEPPEYPNDRARRWIFMRAIQLGWTPDRFGRFESWRNRDSGRSANKVERFGKKYQWLGYFELLAKVRDNFHPMPGFAADTDLSEFPGLWDTFDRDIDPSVPPVEHFHELTEAGAESDTTWKPVRPELRILRFDTPSLKRFVEDQSLDPLTEYATYPRAAEVSDAIDADGDEWLVLDCYHVERVEDRSLEFGMSLDQATIHRAWLVPLDVLETVGQKVAALGHRVHGSDGSPLDSGHGHVDCCYVGELGWRDQGCYHRSDTPTPLDGDDERLVLIPTVEDNTWEAGRYDCSTTTSTVLSAPSARILTNSDLQWDGNLSWTDGMDRPVVVNIGRRDFNRSHLLAVRRDWLAPWLTSNGYGIVLRCWTERRDFRESTPRQFHELASVIALDANLTPTFSGESHGTY